MDCQLLRDMILFRLHPHASTLITNEHQGHICDALRCPEDLNKGQVRRLVTPRGSEQTWQQRKCQPAGGKRAFCERCEVPPLQLFSSQLKCRSIDTLTSSSYTRFYLFISHLRLFLNVFNSFHLLFVSVCLALLAPYAPEGARVPPATSACNRSPLQIALFQMAIWIWKTNLSALRPSRRTICGSTSRSLLSQ